MKQKEYSKKRAKNVESDGYYSSFLDEYAENYNKYTK